MRQREQDETSNVNNSRNLSEDHQENITNYIQQEGYESVLKTLEKVLDYFEDEFGRDDREGRWLGGARLSIADVTLGIFDLPFYSASMMTLSPGLYLHRLYQLGLDEIYFQG